MSLLHCFNFVCLVAFIFKEFEPSYADNRQNESCKHKDLRS